MEELKEACDGGSIDT